jgi:hypothetical protein
VDLRRRRRRRRFDGQGEETSVGTSVLRRSGGAGQKLFESNGCVGRQAFNVFAETIAYYN